MRIFRSHFLGVLALVILCTACGDETARTPATAQQSYGSSVDASDARPGPALAAEPDRYEGRHVTVDGRITGVADDGCKLDLHTSGASPLRIEAPRSDAGCAWTVPNGTDGIAVATGTLRVENDSLQLSANGVQVTPVRVETTDP